MKVSADAPSNIAIVKYWGKLPSQLAMNSSISFTLSKCRSYTHVEANEGDFSLNYLFDNNPKPQFENKILNFLKHLSENMGWEWIKKYSFSIESHNSFPHSAGIASSASFFASLSACLYQLRSKLSGDDFKYEDLSSLARLGSGSAARSIGGGFQLWGAHDSVNPNFAIPLEVNEEFSHICDAVVIVSNSEKKLSSSQGHALMNEHPYRHTRVDIANKRCTQLQQILKKGDWKSFIELTENEAMDLHALIMSSRGNPILLRPQSLEVIDMIRAYRDQHNLNLCFTVDAGPNIHLIYDQRQSQKILPLIKELKNKYQVIEDVLSTSGINIE